MTKAPVALKDTSIFWPEETERKEIADIHASYGFPNCCGIVDGTIFSFRVRSLTLSYTLHSQVFHDNLARIRHIT